jgi:hypothetical protein
MLWELYVLIPLVLILLMVGRGSALHVITSLAIGIDGYHVLRQSPQWSSPVFALWWKGRSSSGAIHVQDIEQAVVASTQRLNPGTMMCFTCLLRWGDCSKVVIVESNSEFDLISASMTYMSTLSGSSSVKNLVKHCGSLSLGCYLCFWGVVRSIFDLVTTPGRSFSLPPL